MQFEQLPVVSKKARFDGKKVMITGAAGVIGAGLARSFAALGATLVLLDKRVPALERLYDELDTLGCECILLGLDLEGATPSDFQDVADNIKDQLGTLDSIIHCATHFKGLSLLEQADPMDWLRSMQVNVNGPFFLTQALIPVLLESKEASVVFMMDETSTQSAFWGAYGVNKWTITGVIKTWGQELEERGVKVLGIDTGPVRSAMRAEIYPGEDPKLMADPAVVTEKIALSLANLESLKGSGLYSAY